MKQTDPPSTARWMLVHLMPGEWNEALAGDLDEEFHAGRPTAWYWSQVFSAIGVRCARELRTHRSALLFASLWSALAPAWLLAVAGLERHANLSQHLSKMNWPWSTFCDLGLMLSTNLLFIWAGILLYLFSDLWIAGSLRLRELCRGILASLPALLVVWVALIVLPQHFVAVHAPDARPDAQLDARLDARPDAQTYMSRPLTPLEAFRRAQQRHWTAQEGVPTAQKAELEASRGASPDTGPRDTITDLSWSAVLVRLPFFLVVLCTLWSTAKRNNMPHERTTA